MSIRCKLRSRGGGTNADPLCAKAYQLILSLDEEIERLKAENEKLKNSTSGNADNANDKTI